MAKSNSNGIAAALVVIAGAALIYKYWPGASSQVVQLSANQPLHTPDFSNTSILAPDFGTGIVGAAPTTPDQAAKDQATLVSILTLGGQAFL